MCGGVKYTDSVGKEWKIYFPNPKAALPITKPDGEVEWVKWGRRKEEATKNFVQGGWARKDSIRKGKWARFNPKPVLLGVQEFMEKDEQRTSHWIVVPQGKAIQAIIATVGEETRLYVVTEDTPPEYTWVHDRWPHIVDILGI